MKLKPIINTGELQSQGMPFITRVMEWARGRGKTLGILGGGLLVVTLLLTGKVFLTKIQEDNAAILLVRARRAEDYLQLLQQYPRARVAPLAAYSLARAYEEKKDLAQAQTTYQLFVEKHPEHFLIPQARFALAFLAEQQGDWAGALKLYRELYATPEGEIFGAEITAAIERCSRRLAGKS